MHRRRMALSPSDWANLDALVLEEVDALDATETPPRQIPLFNSEDDFLTKATAYLRQRQDPQQLIEALAAGLDTRHSPDKEDDEHLAVIEAGPVTEAAVTEPEPSGEGPPP
jgi:hypothetical protein